jgi:hypothetical protein
MKSIVLVTPKPKVKLKIEKLREFVRVFTDFLGTIIVYKLLKNIYQEG